MYTAIGFVFNKEQPYESASKALSNFCNEIDRKKVDLIDCYQNLFKQCQNDIMNLIYHELLRFEHTKGFDGRTEANKLISMYIEEARKLINTNMEDIEKLGVGIHKNNQYISIGLALWEYYQASNFRIFGQRVFVRDKVKNSSTDQYFPLDHNDYFAIFIALTLLTEATDLFKIIDENNKDFVIRLILHAHSIIQMCIGNNDGFYTGRAITQKVQKSTFGQSIHKRTEAYEQFYELCYNLFLEKVSLYYSKHGNNIGMWKDKTSCLRDILQTNLSDEPEHPRMLALRNKLRKSVGLENICFPLLSKFNEKLTIQMKQNPDYKNLFKRKSNSK